MLATATGRPLCGQTTIMASPSWPRATFRQRMTGTGVSGAAPSSGSTSYQRTDCSISSLSFAASCVSGLAGGCAPDAASSSNTTDNLLIAASAVIGVSRSDTSRHVGRCYLPAGGAAGGVTWNLADQNGLS